MGEKLNLVRYSFVLLFVVCSLLLRAQKAGIGGDFSISTYWGGVNSNKILADLTNNSGMELLLKVDAKVWQFLSLVAGINDGKLNRNDAKSDIACHKFSKLSFFSEIFKFGGFSQVCPYPFRLKNFISILIPFMQFSLSSYNFNPKMNFNLKKLAFQPFKTEGWGRGLGRFGTYYTLWSERTGAGSLMVEISEKCTTIPETGMMIFDTCYLENVNTCYFNSYELGSINVLLSDQLPDITAEIRNLDELLHCENGVKRVGPVKELYSVSGLSFLTHYQAHQKEKESGSLLKFSFSNLNKQ